MQDRHSGVDIVAVVELFGIFNHLFVVVAAFYVLERGGVDYSDAGLGCRDRPDVAAGIAVRHIHLFV